MTVDFVRLTTGVSCCDAKYILTVFVKTIGGDWCIRFEGTPCDCLCRLLEESGQADDVVFASWSEWRWPMIDSKDAEGEYTLSRGEVC